MKGLTEYIIENFDDYFKMSDDDRLKLIDLDYRLHLLTVEFGKEQIHFAHVENIKEEIDRISGCIADNKDFEINHKYEKSKFSDDEWVNNIIEKFNDVKNGFSDLNTCYLTKFYIYKIERLIDSALFFNEYSKDKIFPKNIKRPSEKVYLEAVKILKDNKFIDVHKLKDEKYKRNKDPEYSRKRLQGIIDKLGYGWKVIIQDNMIPRMAVEPYGEFYISRTNLFSEVDLQSLEVHEIQVHTARKYYALQTGLYLFLHGLAGHDILDEGMAIFNSLTKTETPKPNILFYIAIKIILLYNFYKMSNLELFNFIRELTNAPDNVIILAMIRASRIFSFNRLFASSSDEDYLTGYLMVKDMTEEQRKDLLKYNIGPQQLHEIGLIKKFLRENKFKPIKKMNLDRVTYNDDDNDSY